MNLPHPDVHRQKSFEIVKKAPGWQIVKKSYEIVFPQTHSGRDPEAAPAWGKEEGERAYFTTTLVARPWATTM